MASLRSDLEILCDKYSVEAILDKLADVLMEKRELYREVDRPMSNKYEKLSLKVQHLADTCDINNTYKQRVIDYWKQTSQTPID